MDETHCQKHQFFDDVVGRCANCADICMPIRGTSRECLQYCQDDYYIYFPKPVTVTHSETNRQVASDSQNTTIAVISLGVLLVVLGVSIAFCIIIRKQLGKGKEPTFRWNRDLRLKRPKRMKASMESAVVKEFNEQHILLPNPNHDLLTPFYSKHHMVPVSVNTGTLTYDSSTDANSQTPLLPNRNTPTTSVQMESQPPDQVGLSTNNEAFEVPMSPECLPDQTARKQSNVLVLTPPTREHCRHGLMSLHESSNSLQIDDSHSLYGHDTSSSHNRHYLYIAQPSDAGLSDVHASDNSARPADQLQNDGSCEIPVLDNANNVVEVAEDEGHEHNSLDEDADSALGSRDPVSGSIESRGSFNNDVPHLACSSSMEHLRGAESEETEHGIIQCAERNEAYSSPRHSRDTGIESMLTTEKPSSSSNHQSPIPESISSNLMSDTSCSCEVQNREETLIASDNAKNQHPTRIHVDGLHSSPFNLGSSPQRSPGVQSESASMPSRSRYPEKSYTRGQLRGLFGDIEKMDDIELGMTMNSLHSA